MLGKRFNLGLGAAALVLLLSGGIGRADGPLPAGPDSPGCGADGACAADGCCAAQGCKMCVPTPANKVVVLRHYGEKCEDFCVCKPTFLGGLFNLREALEKDRYQYVGRGPGDMPCGECGECGGCGCGGNCGNPYVKKFLLIYAREHTECEVKCQIPGEPESAGRAAAGIPVAAPSQRPFPAPRSLEPQRGPIIGNEPGTNLPGPAK
jgi:hypothetical protein